MTATRTYPIEYGDRIYVRALQGMDTILEISVENVADFTQLIGEIRYAGRALEGLSKLIIRNHSRGWSCERMIKFYNGTLSPRRQALREALHEAAATLRSEYATPSVGVSSHTASRAVSRHRPSTYSRSYNSHSQHMPFPWETH